MPIHDPVGSLGGFENCQNDLQETETSLDLSQTSIHWALTFLDSEPDNSKGAIDSEMSNRLLLCLEESQSGEEGLKALGQRETGGRQDGANARQGS